MCVPLWRRLSEGNAATHRGGVMEKKAIHCVRDRSWATGAASALDFIHVIYPYGFSVFNTSWPQYLPERRGWSDCIRETGDWKCPQLPWVGNSSEENGRRRPAATRSAQASGPLPRPRQARASSLSPFTFSPPRPGKCRGTTASFYPNLLLHIGWWEKEDLENRPLRRAALTLLSNLSYLWSPGLQMKQDPEDVASPRGERCRVRILIWGPVYSARFGPVTQKEVRSALRFWSWTATILPPPPSISPGVKRHWL